jgi:fructokinase
MDNYGGIEAGGTKFVCMVANGPQEILAETRFPTTTPAETIGRAIEFFRRHQPLKAIGVACFGPVDLDPTSPTYGFITTTPKPGWANTNVAGLLRMALGVPVAFDTDVNGAALSEYTWGAAQACDPALYLTVGTGIGGGCLINGKPMHGLVHPEMGHIRLVHDWQADPYAGFCPYHGDCFEGLAAGPAIKLRWGNPAETLPLDHPAWELEAHYVALALSDLICTLSPKRIVLGGGVLEHPGLVERVRVRVQELLNGYVQSPVILKNIDEYIVRPGLGSRAGVLGAIALARNL